MAGLEDVGIPGPEHLKEALANCTDPIQAITDFQVANGILLPSLRPALPFLDLHGIRRLDFHQSIMEELRNRLMQRLDEFAAGDSKNKEKLLEDLLTKSFPVIKVQRLRPVIWSIMKHVSKLKPEYLTVIKSDKCLYKEAPVEVKQHIWQDDQALFGDEVSPLLARYLSDKEKQILLEPTDFLSLPPRLRRQQGVIPKLVEMIGRHIKLYDLVLQFLRTLFLRTKIVHYCTLRTEILMALHDKEVHEICTLDPCHKFAWCLDACIKENVVDTKRAIELQGFLDGVRRGQEQVLGDISMILCDPFAMYTVGCSIIRILHNCANTETLPRNNEDILLLVRMLSLGLNAWTMIGSRHYKEPKLDGILVTKFLIGLMHLMIDDHMTAICAKITDQPPHQADDPLQCLLTLGADSALATVIMSHYVAGCVRNKERSAVVRALHLLSECQLTTAYQETSLQLIVGSFADHSELLSNNDVCDALFHTYLLVHSAQQAVYCMTVRLLIVTHSKLPQIKLNQLLTKLQPKTQHSEECHKAYTDLQEMISGSAITEPSVNTPDKLLTLNSPLLSVPGPTAGP